MSTNLYSFIKIKNKNRYFKSIKFLNLAMAWFYVENYFVWLSRLNEIQAINPGENFNISSFAINEGLCN